MTRPPRAFDPADTRPQIPDDLTGKLVYFTHLETDPLYGELNQKLLLISQDNRMELDQFDSDMVFGYVMNTPLLQTFQGHFAEAAKNFPSRFKFLQIMNSATERFEPVEAGFITFITTSGQPLGTLNELIFGDYAAYTCESLEEANEMEKYLRNKQDIVMVHSLFAIETERLAGLIRMEKALVRDATPEIVFNQSAFMRTVLAFPDAAPKPAP